jgi:ribose 5-phosphate isomerase A
MPINSPNPAAIDSQKQAAARAAVARVRSGMRVGLGSGTTSAHAVRALAERMTRERLEVVCVATSAATAALAVELGIVLAPDRAAFRLDIAIDGADEVTRHGDAIKGGGGALLHERIVAAASDEFLVVADATKLVERLGACPLPVEVVVFGSQNVFDRLTALGYRPRLRVQADGTTFVTAEGNYILDCQLSRAPGVTPTYDLHALDQSLRAIAGVVDHGLFLGMATRMFIAGSSGVEEIVLPRGRG